MANLKKIWKTRFAIPFKHYLIGAGCTFNIAGNYYPRNYPRKCAQSHAETMVNAWEKTGKYLYNAMGMQPPKKTCSYNKSHNLQLPDHVRRILTAYLKHKRRQRAASAGGEKSN